MGSAAWPGAVPHPRQDISPVPKRNQAAAVEAGGPAQGGSQQGQAGGTGHCTALCCPTPQQLARQSKKPSRCCLALAFGGQYQQASRTRGMERRTGPDRETRASPGGFCCCSPWPLSSAGALIGFADPRVWRLKPWNTATVRGLPAMKAHEGQPASAGRVSAPPTTGASRASRCMRRDTEVGRGAAAAGRGGRSVSQWAGEWLHPAALTRPASTCLCPLQGPRAQPQPGQLSAEDSPFSVKEAMVVFHWRQCPVRWAGVIARSHSCCRRLATRRQARAGYEWAGQDTYGQGRIRMGRAGQGRE